jgi:hypothetical protein
LRVGGNIVDSHFSFLLEKYKHKNSFSTTAIIPQIAAENKMRKRKSPLPRGKGLSSLPE